MRRALAFVLPPLLCLSFTACESEPEAPADETGTESGDGDPGDGDPGDGDPGDGDPGDGDPGDGDGDGDPGDGDGDPGTCDVFDGTPTPIVAAATAADAATASITSTSGTIYEVTLPEGAAGFLELQIADWETIQAVYTVADIDYTVSVFDNSQVEMARTPIDGCVDITEQRYGFPHWTPATIEFSATGPRVVPLLVVQQ